MYYSKESGNKKKNELILLSNKKRKTCNFVILFLNPTIPKNIK